MHPTPPSPAPSRRARAAIRLFATLGCATMLAGCLNDQIATPVGFDYRLRHPIAIKEGPRTMQLFIGANRGGLTPEQRADVLAFARTWRREVTGGMVIDLPSGTRNEFAAASAVQEVQA